MGKVEQNLQSKILRDLNSMGKSCVAFDVMKCSEDGVPDIFFTTSVTGAVFIEVKKPDGVLSAKQKEMIENMIYCGTKAIAVWSWTEWVVIKKALKL